VSSREGINYFSPEAKDAYLFENCPEAVIKDKALQPYYLPIYCGYST